jgi:hypothetical protein
MFRNAFWYFSVSLALLCALVPVRRLCAGPWAEVGDAGDLPGTAQLTLGVGTLDSISGVIFTSNDKDMYEIKIVSPATFSAIVIAGGTLTDSQLFLLDSLGGGIYANDDTTALDPLSTLPAGDPNGPQAAGTYLLAISGSDNDPMSGPIETFTDNAPGVQTPATLNPVDGWSPGFSVFGGTYTIVLTGAEFSKIPEPATCFLGFSGILGLVLRRQRP